MKRTNIAAIDLGSNSFHLVIVRLKSIESSMQKFEVESRSQFEILYKQREVVRLNDLSFYDSNLINNRSISRALEVLKVFKEKADEFNAEIFAVATSVIREAPFSEKFISIVKGKLGFEIQVAAGFEEARLIYLGVLQGLDVFNKQILLIDIGGGSTEFLIGRRGKVIYTASLKLGAVRLTRDFFGFKDYYDDLSKKKCEEFIREKLETVIKPIKKIGYDEVIGTAGTLTSLGSMIHETLNDSLPIHGKTINSTQLKTLVLKILSCKSFYELKSIPYIDESRLDIIMAGAMITKEVFDGLKIYDMTLSTYAFREGIIIDALEKVYLKDSFAYSSTLPENLYFNQKIKSALNLAKFYDTDIYHILHVRKISLLLFDELKSLHKLDENSRELLEFASILHDIGYNISPQKHHKHSYHLIINSALVGFSNEELKIIATIARYHRKSLPQKTHKVLIDFSNDEFKKIEILSAILRLADALEKTHSALINDLKIIPMNSKRKFKLVLRYLTNTPKMEFWTAQKRKSALEKALKVKFELNLEKIII